MTSDAQLKAKKIVSIIMTDLTGRRGIRQAFEECEADILQQLIETLENKVEDYLIEQS